MPKPDNVLRSFMLKKGLTYEQFGELLGLSGLFTHLVVTERRITDPKLSTLKRIHDVTGIPYPKLLTFFLSQLDKK